MSHGATADALVPQAQWAPTGGTPADYPVGRFSRQDTAAFPHKTPGTIRLGSFSTVAAAGLISVQASAADSATDPVVGPTSILTTHKSASGNRIGAPALATGVDVSAMAIRSLMRFPDAAANKGNIQAAEVRLYSTSNPASPGSNYHKATFYFTTDLIPQRWHLFSVDISDFVAVGSGATLTSIRYVEFGMQGAGATGFQFQPGYIEAVPRALSKAVAILSFDDGYVDQFTYAAVQLEKYGFPGVVFPILGNIDLTTSFWMSKEMIRHLHDELGWQIGTHADTTANHNTVLTGDALQQEKIRCRQWGAALGVHGGEDMSYHGATGAYHYDDDNANDRVKRVARTCRNFFVKYGGTNGPRQIETLPLGDPMNIRGYGPGSSDASASLTGWVDRAIACNGLAMFVWHNGLSTAGTFQTSFLDLLAYLDSHRSTIDVMTMDQLCRKLV